MCLLFRGPLKIYVYSGVPFSFPLKPRRETRRNNHLATTPPARCLGAIFLGPRRASAKLSCDPERVARRCLKAEWSTTKLTGRWTCAKTGAQGPGIPYFVSVFCFFFFLSIHVRLEGVAVCFRSMRGWKRIGGLTFWENLLGPRVRLASQGLKALSSCCPFL